MSDEIARVSTTLYEDEANSADDHLDPQVFDDDINPPYDLLNGTSTDKRRVTTYSHATQAVDTLTQNGAGPIARFTGTADLIISNEGAVKGVNAIQPIDVTMYLKGALSVSALLFPVFMVDQYTDAASGGTSPQLTGLRFIHRTNTTAGTHTIILKKNAAGTTVATLTIPASTAPFTVVSVSFSETPTLTTDFYWIDVTAVGGTIANDVTLQLVGNQHWWGN